MADFFKDYKKSPPLLPPKKKRKKNSQRRFHAVGQQSEIIKTTEAFHFKVNVCFLMNFQALKLLPREG